MANLARVFEERCAVQVYTFGTGFGWKATLNTLPADVDAGTEGMEPKGKASKVNSRLEELAKDLLLSLDIITTTQEGDRLLNTPVPSLPIGLFGKATPDKKKSLGKALVSALQGNVPEHASGGS